MKFSDKQLTNHQIFRSRFIILTFLFLLCWMTYQQTAFRSYPLANDYFQKIYLVKFNRKDYYLAITCKQANMLSISLTQNYQFKQAPRFNIYGNDPNPPRMAGEVYTFLQQCRANIKINTDNFIEVRREVDSEVIFAIKDLSFQLMHTKFVVIDPSIKWGLGQRFQRNFHIKDGKWTIWNRDKPWKIDEGSTGISEQTYGFQPVYLAKQHSNKYHLSYFKNTHALLVQSTKSSEQLVYNSVGGNLHFVIILGQQNPEAVLQKYHQYIGKAHIPPFWSLGFHQSRWGYKSLNQISQVVAKYNQHDIPLDIIWSDLEYMDKKMIFTINEYTHPSANFNKLLQKEKLHFVPLIDVGVSINDYIAINKGKSDNVFLKDVRNKNQNYVGEVWPGQVHFVDYLHPNATKFWMGQLQRLYQKVKFSGIWLDMNQPSNFRGNEPCQQTFRIQQNQGINQMTINVDLKHYSKIDEQALYHREVHPYFGHLSTVATYEYLKKNGRPFIISRSNSVGTGYFAGHWTGDNVATWDFLRLSINGNFLFQIFGIQMVGADICGFYRDSTEQLCSRWMQLGAFYPFSRNHNHEQARSQEAYALGQTLLKTSLYSLRTRYALLKQLYTILLEKKGKGSFFRPLFFQFYDDEETFSTETAQTQFLLGKYLMVSPIVYQNANDRSVYFPGSDQKWYQFQIDYNTGRTNANTILKFDGKTTATILNQLPAAPPTYLRGGYLILTNKPQKRSIFLNNEYHIFSALKNNKSQGEILAPKDVNNQENIKICISYHCLLKFELKKVKTNQFSITWKYEGDKDIFGVIKIKSTTIIDEENRWSSEEQFNIESLQGSKTIIISV